MRYNGIGNKIVNITSLKLTWHLKMDGWNTTFLLGRSIFRGYVSFREGKHVQDQSFLLLWTPHLQVTGEMSKL